MSETYDLVVIGGGPGGYTAAVRAAQFDMKVACIEKETRLGGTCLNIGCIPSKALLDSSEFYYAAKNQFAEHGINIGKTELDLSAMMARKEKVVEELTLNIRGLLERHKVEIIQGTAKITAKDKVEIKRERGSTEILTAKNILIASGSKPIAVPGLEFDGKYIVSSTEALAFESVPESIGIVGGGYIGLELGSVWARLGSKVTVIEMLPQIAPAMDSQIARTLKRILTKQGIFFRLKSKVTKAEISGEKVNLALESDRKEETQTYDRVLVCVGRRPFTEGLGLEEVGIKTDSRTGHVLTDAFYRTNIPNIRAIGDIIYGPMLAHKASAEAVAAVEAIAGLPGEVNYDAIPSVIYTWPEASSVGLTEDQVKERNIPYGIGVYPFSGLGRARCMGETDGLAKIISHAKSDRVLGVHMIGARVSEIIGECALALEFGASAEDLARTVHAHPTFSEALQEAAMAVK